MTSPVSLPAGSKITAAKLDAYENITSAWTSYTPTWGSSGTQPALGNGTLTGVYMQAGKLLMVRILLTLGSTSTVGTGVYSLSLPVAPQVGSLLGAMFKDSSAGTARYPGIVEIITATAGGDNMRIVVAGSTLAVGATVPVVPATGDQLIVAGTYEAA